jgi:tetratricopeptide (TPR) repeat protein
VLGDDHPRTLTSINNIGALLKSMGKLKEAELYYREALDGRRRVLGDDHPDTLRSINNIGFLYKSIGRYEEAETYYREGMKGNRRVLGDDHPTTLTLIGAEAVEGARRALPAGHWRTGVFLDGYGRALTKLGRHEEAEQALLEAHGIRLAAHGAEHQRTIKAVNALADLYDAWHEAEPDKGYDAKAAEWREKLPEPTEASEDD